MALASSPTSSIKSTNFSAGVSLSAAFLTDFSQVVLKLFQGGSLADGSSLFLLMFWLQAFSYAIRFCLPLESCVAKLSPSSHDAPERWNYGS